ncbi:MAG: 4Fe-4S dicluster domain-containing protein [Nitrospirae bacterium]|nr:4Fe-4S dicluster domain-containing protein [Nitrospirota bacterium]
MVLDLNKCLGCQTCTVACKKLWTSDLGQEGMWWNHVETKPGEGWPRGWERMNPVNTSGAVGGMPTPATLGRPWSFGFEEQDNKDVFGPGDQQEPWGPNWDEDIGGGTYPNSYYFYLPRMCNHCANPACVPVCPNQAIYKRERDGIVLIDDTQCKGTRLCHMACPYKKIYFTEAKGVSQKCIFCFPRVEKGTAPACARQCPGRLRYVGFADDPAGPIHALVKKWKVALPLHPEFGTEPNVFYVPPRAPATYDTEGRLQSAPRIPLAYLVQLFGDGVQSALDTLERERAVARSGRRSELMDLLIGYRFSDRFRIPVARAEGTIT